jgi:hypothetical protein
MYRQSLLAIFGLSTIGLADVTAQVGEGGVTRIYGNSFGVPGIDVSYDYVVSGSTACRSVDTMLTCPNC